MKSVERVNKDASNLIGMDPPEREVSVQLIRGVYEDCKPEVSARCDTYTDVGFSDREAEVLALSEAGFTSKAVAVMLGISSSTVDQYKSRAKKKRDRARKLLRAVDGTGVFNRTLRCPHCGHGTVPSKSKAEVEDGVLTFRCRDCWETIERRIW